ncbi:MAG: endonuclease/exonuclease/phosphatase family protein [Bacteroidales bacterium]|nr:endonuclease/exonuclease/phosphatase family protein [Bacteroidales bacterium]
MRSFLFSILPLALFFFYIFSIIPFAQGQEDDKKFLALCVAYYNVENLFDTINDPDRNDDEFTPDGTNRWTSDRYYEKLDRLAEVISKMGLELTPDGPAVIGLGEVENEDVVWDLARQERIKDRNYQVIHFRSRDRRIDNAFMYNPRYFEVTNTKAVPTIIEDMPDFRTRDHLVVSGLLLGEPIHFIVAHWPSRRGGEARSRPLRIAAADVARSIIDSLKAEDPNAKVIFMGDLNDDPTDISVRRHLNAQGDKDRLKDGQLFNPFVEFARRGIGTLAWRDSWNLFDQIILTQSLLNDDYSTFKYLRAEVFNRPFLRQPSGRFQGYPFRSYGGGVYLGGYSDHFPTYVFLIREIK